MVKVFSRYGGLSRGKVWGKVDGSTPARWAEKSGGALLLTPGKWFVGSSDGFSRKDSAVVTVHEDGTVDDLPRG